MPLIREVQLILVTVDKIKEARVFSTKRAEIDVCAVGENTATTAK